MSPRTLTVPGGDAEVMLWLIAHGFAPHDIRCDVTIAGDVVVLERVCRDADGRSKVDWVAGRVVTEPVVVVPTYPFPWPRTD